jgi:hypothetical protein
MNSKSQTANGNILIGPGSHSYHLLTILLSGLATLRLAIYPNATGRPADVADRARDPIRIADKSTLSSTLPHSIGCTFEATPSLDHTLPSAPGSLEFRLPQTAIQRPEAQAHALCSRTYRLLQASRFCKFAERRCAFDQRQPEQNVGKVYGTEIGI